MRRVVQFGSHILAVTWHWQVLIGVYSLTRASEQAWLVKLFQCPHHAWFLEYSLPVTSSSAKMSLYGTVGRLDRTYNSHVTLTRPRLRYGFRETGSCAVCSEQCLLPLETTHVQL